MISLGAVADHVLHLRTLFCVSPEVKHMTPCVKLPFVFNALILITQRTTSIVG